jgi:hypothetical protein
MHIAITNLIVWVKFIMAETLKEYYEYVLEENLELLNDYSNSHSYTTKPMISM